MTVYETNMDLYSGEKVRHGPLWCHVINNSTLDIKTVVPNRALDFLLFYWTFLLPGVGASISSSGMLKILILSGKVI